MNEGENDEDNGREGIGERIGAVWGRYGSET